MRGPRAPRVHDVLTRSRESFAPERRRKMDDIVALGRELHPGAPSRPWRKRQLEQQRMTFVSSGRGRLDNPIQRLGAVAVPIVRYRELLGVSVPNRRDRPAYTRVMAPYLEHVRKICSDFELQG